MPESATVEIARINEKAIFAGIAFRTVKAKSLKPDIRRRCPALLRDHKYWILTIRRLQDRSCIGTTHPNDFHPLPQSDLVHIVGIRTKEKSYDFVARIDRSKVAIHSLRICIDHAAGIGAGRDCGSDFWIVMRQYHCAVRFDRCLCKRNTGREQKNTNQAGEEAFFTVCPQSARMGYVHRAVSLERRAELAGKAAAQTSASRSLRSARQPQNILIAQVRLSATPRSVVYRR